MKHRNKDAEECKAKASLSILDTTENESLTNFTLNGESPIPKNMVNMMNKKQLSVTTN